MFFKLFISNFSLLIQKVQNYRPYRKTLFLLMNVRPSDEDFITYLPIS